MICYNIGLVLILTHTVSVSILIYKLKHEVSWGSNKENNWVYVIVIFKKVTLWW